MTETNQQRAIRKWDCTKRKFEQDKQGWRMNIDEDINYIVAMASEHTHSLCLVVSTIIEYPTPCMTLFDYYIHLKGYWISIWLTHCHQLTIHILWLWTMPIASLRFMSLRVSDSCWPEFKHLNDGRVMLVSATTDSSIISIQSQQFRVLVADTFIDAGRWHFKSYWLARC